MKNDIIAFLQENIQRLKQKSPKFFKAWNLINSVALILSGLPTVLNMLDIPDLETILPNATGKLILKIITYASAWGLLMNKLTVQSNHEIIEDNGTLIQKPCEDLPYTGKKEGYKLIEPKQVTN